MEKLLTIKQIAQATGLSSVTLYKAIESKDPATRLAHHKFGKAVKVSESDLEKWIASKRVVTAPAGRDASTS